ncbi:MAG TPA: zinc-binding dehydrogenase, partial [Jiangellaceae bacterium]
ASTAGASQRCPQRRVIGVQPDISAAFAERMVAPSRNVLPLPDGTPPDVGSLVEPLAVGYHAVQRAALSPDDAVFVLGGGPIGQAAALAARRLGSSRVVVAELDAARRDLVTRLGFSTVDPAKMSASEITAALGGPAAVVVDAVGTSRTLQTAFDTSVPGARIVLVGMGAPRVEIAAYAVSTEEREVFGSFAYDDAAFRDTVHWAAANAPDLEPLIERRVELDEAPETFRALAAGELTAGKVLVQPQRSGRQA